jgi:hypothetical protein
MAEGGTLTLSAPRGWIFVEVVFASYGTPSEYTQGWCHAGLSESIASSAFLDRSEGQVFADNAMFGDPCIGSFKAFAVVLKLARAPTGGGGGYFDGGYGAPNGGGGGGSSFLGNLRAYGMSDTASLYPGVCAGSYSKYFSYCSSSCGASGTHGCVVLETEVEAKINQQWPMKRCKKSNETEQ